MAYLAKIWFWIIGFDIRDLFIFGGLSMLFYGLYQYDPPLAFVVCGPLLMVVGYLMRDK
jgi:hypothetical protein